MPVLDSADFVIIAQAIAAGGKIWENEILDPVKAKIKAHYREVLNENCCYCRRDTTDEFNMVLDIEHVLPKASYSLYMFTPFNLSMSCKRCNVEIKKNKITFLLNPAIPPASAEDTNNYRLIHPNFDIYSHHLTKEIYQYEDKKLVKYSVVNASSKGIYTKDFFELYKFEQDSFNSAQGAPTKIFSDLIPHDLVKAIQDLLK